MPNPVQQGYDRLRRVVGRGVFPHQFSWLIDNVFRRAIITPEQLVGRIDPAHDATVVELGPGSGYFSVRLAQRAPNGHVILMDVQVEMLLKARRKLARMGVTNASFVVCDGNVPFPLRVNSVDVVVMVSVLGEVKDRLNCAMSAFRMLRRGGAAIIHESIPDPDLIKFETLLRIMQEAGFEFFRRWGPAYNYTAAFLKPHDTRV